MKPFLSPLRLLLTAAAVGAAAVPAPAWRAVDCANKPRRGFSDMGAMAAVDVVVGAVVEVAAAVLILAQDAGRTGSTCMVGKV